MFTITNKKGVSPIGLLGEILIVLTVIIILLAIVIVPKLFKQSDIAGVQLTGIQGDMDKDGVRNFFDQCPCTFGEIVADGCPIAFTDEQKKEDVQKYNSEPICGIVSGETGTSTSTEASSSAKPSSPQEKQEASSEPAAFKQYQSIEIFGGDDWGADPEDAVIKQACTGWVGGSGGTNCHSEDDDCDGNFNLDPLKGEGKCWIMASEDDDSDPNDCGQAKVDSGTIIPLDEYKDLQVDVGNNYQSTSNEDEPKNLFLWRWKSTSAYGALLCDNGIWKGCLEKNEGRTLMIGEQTYECAGSEWKRVGSVLVKVKP
jgi:hypothetical protein